MEQWVDLLERLTASSGDEPVKLPSPKNQFATDVCMKTDIPIFATSKAKVESAGKHNMRDNRETEMPDVR